MTVVELVKDPAKVDALLAEIDRIAHAHNPYEYGLPTYDEGQMAILREAVYKWAAQ